MWSNRPSQSAGLCWERGASWSVSPAPTQSDTDRAGSAGAGRNPATTGARGAADGTIQSHPGLSCPQRSDRQAQVRGKAELHFLKPPKIPNSMMSSILGILNTRLHLPTLDSDPEPA